MLLLLFDPVEGNAGEADESDRLGGKGKDKTGREGKGGKYYQRF